MKTSTPSEIVSTPSKLPTLAAATLLCVMLVGGWQFVSATRHVPDMKVPWTLTDFREGRTTGALEKQIDEHLPGRSQMIAFANSLRYLITRGAGEQVRLGRDDWLFLTEELQFDAKANSSLALRTKLLADTSLALSAKGTQLVVALVPDKARVYPEKLSAGTYPDYNANRYADALVQLQKAGVVVVDVLTPLTETAKSQQVYYRTDTHWNQLGAKVAALAVAKQLTTLNLNAANTQFATTTEATAHERPGDLIRLMGLANMPNALRPQPDMEAPETTQQTSADAPAGLFGDSAVDVVLTGTSYSLRGNFHGHLQQALSAKVLNSAKDGGGLLQATSNYLTDDAFASAPPKILVWEIPERFLTLPLGQEEQFLQTTRLQVPGKSQ